MFGHRFKFWFAGLLGGYSFLNIFFLDGDRLFAAAIDPFALLSLILVLTFSVWGLNLLVEKTILRKSWPIHPLIVQFLGGSILSLVLAFISAEITGLLLGGPFSFSWQNFLLTAAFTSRINLFLNCVNAIYFFSQKLKEKAVEAERLRTLTTEAKLQSINSQLNPHFFFNNLSALSVLIHQDVQLADRYLQKLSEIYRHILRNKNNELIPLSEELDFLKNYLELLSIRFEDSLSFYLQIEDSVMDKLIPPAVLQLLVENVVKHNYFTRKEPLEIRITCTKDSIRIFNKKQFKIAVEESTGIGLQNISDRYRFLEHSIRIENESDHFQVELPLIDDKTPITGRRRTAGSSEDLLDYSVASPRMGHR
jgi:two-component system, LytTR family, sensor kinase